MSPFIKFKSLEWPKSERLTTLSADKDVKQQELSCIAGGNAKYGRQFCGFLQN